MSLTDPAETGTMIPFLFVGGTLPSGGEFGAALQDDVIVVRVTDQASVVHPKWMTREQTAQLYDALAQLLMKWPAA